MAHVPFVTLPPFLKFKIGMPQSAQLNVSQKIFKMSTPQKFTFPRYLAQIDNVQVDLLNTIGTLNDPYDNFVTAMVTEYLKAEYHLIATITFNI